MIRFVELNRMAARTLVVLVVAFAAKSPARAQEGASLLQAVPPDVHFCVHSKLSKTPDPATIRMEKAWKLIIDSRVHRDIIDLFVLDLPEGPRQMIVGQVDRALDLLGKVDWSLLVHEESVFAFRMGIGFPDYLFLSRVPKDRMASQIAGMKEMISGFAAMIGPMAVVRDVERPSGNTTVLSLQGMPVPIELAFGSVGDVLVVSTSSQLTASSMNRVSSGGEGSMAKNERFQTALKSLPPPGDAMTFVDVDGLLNFMTQALTMAQMGMQGNDHGTAIAREVMHVVLVVLREFNQVDHVLATVASDGTSTTTTTLTQMLPSYATSQLSKLFAAQKPWDGWSKRVPADATSFVFDSGLDPAALHDFLLASAKEGLSDSAPILAKWDAMQSEWGVKVRDILAAFSGESALIEFPQAGTDGCALGEAVCILRLEKPDVVGAEISRLLEKAVAYVRSRGQKIEIESVRGMNRIRVEAFPWIRPVVGVKGSELVIATSAAALDKLDRVASGKDPDIRSNPRFTALGAGKSDSTRYISYVQIETGVAPLADVVSAYGFVFAMLPDDKDLAVMRKIGSILTKTAPALREMDMRFDAEEEIVSASADASVTRSIVRYR